MINNLGLIEGDQKNFDEAARCHQEALEIGSKSPPVEVAIWLNNLANVREQQGDMNEAGKLHLQALPLRTNALAPGHPAVGASLESLARVRLKQDQPAEAQSLAKQCLDLWEQRDADDWRAFHARSLLGGSLLAQKNYAAAEPLLRSGGEGLIQREARIPRAARPRLREAVERVVQLYESTGDSAQAAEWRKKLAALDQPEP
ncbi:MAG: tetratricopeptide repeat protein [Verrucomicrobia bacterium]|nr:tetratricopeptide repeat protein [Verrucomicrobiota bacterium]